jgi:hypothetical protein
VLRDHVQRGHTLDEGNEGLETFRADVGIAFEERTSVKADVGLIPALLVLAAKVQADPVLARHDGVATDVAGIGSMRGYERKSLVVSW